MYRLLKTSLNRHVRSLWKRRIACLLLAVAFSASLANAQQAMPASDLLTMIQRNELGRAEAILRRNLDRADERPAIHYLLGVVLTRRWALKDAAQHLAIAVDKKPEHPGWQFAYAHALAMDGQCLAAMPHFEQALLREFNEDWLLGKVRCQFSMGDFNAVTETLANHVSETSQHAGLTAAMAEALLQLNRPQEAKPLLLRAIELDQGNIAALIGLARVHALLHEDEAAMVIYERVLNALPEHGVSLYALAQILRQHGNLTRANELLQHFTKQQQRSEQQTDFLQYLSTNPEDATAHLSLAKLQFTSGEFDNAIGSLRRALVLDPSQTESYHWLALAHAARGDRTEAERFAALSAALQEAPRPDPTP